MHSNIRSHRDPVQALSDLRPVHTCTPRSVPGENSLLDPAFWEGVEQRRLARQAWMTTLSFEAASYESGVGQSSREDYHREYAVLYGMRALLPTATPGTLSFGQVADLLNTVVNVNEGRTETYRKAFTIESEPITSYTAVFSPLDQVQRVLAILDTWAKAFGSGVAQVPAWSPRIQSNGTVYRLREVTIQRPSVVEYRTVTEPMAKQWANPHQVEDGFTFLPDTAHRNMRKAGAEGLSVLVTNVNAAPAEWDSPEPLGPVAVPQYHIVHWVTAYRTKTRRMAKKPLAIYSMHDTEEHEALAEMHRIAQAMSRTSEWNGSLLPWQAAAMADEFGDLPPLLTGSHEWLAQIADQRESGEVYRNRGAGPDA